MKLKLSLADLEVSSFSTAARPEDSSGTVRGLYTFVEYQCVPIVVTENSYCQFTATGAHDCEVPTMIGYTCEVGCNAGQTMNTCPAATMAFNCPTAYYYTRCVNYCQP